MQRARTLIVAALLVAVFVLAVRLFANAEGRRVAGVLLAVGAVALVLTDRGLRR